VAIFNHRLIIGTTYQPASAFRLATDDVPVDLTGCTGLVRLKADVNADPVLLTPTFALVDAADGRFTFSAPASETALLSPGKAYYAVRITYPSGTVEDVIEGEVIISRTATS
jgi:hypothetical protein